MCHTPLPPSPVPPVLVQLDITTFTAVCETQGVRNSTYAEEFHILQSTTRSPQLTSLETCEVFVSRAVEVGRALRFGVVRKRRRQKQQSQENSGGMQTRPNPKIQI